MIRVNDPENADRVLAIGEPETDPVLVAKLRALFDRSARNAAWYEAHAAEIHREHPGRYIAVYDGRLYVGDDPKSVADRVRADHPGDWGGSFRSYIRPRPVA
ncbi:MAG: hypothetical protein K2X87_32900 [Gemmataceae bacterium]|nr:hypothetical protein [Gemmataceae bacterium]